MFRPDPEPLFIDHKDNTCHILYISVKMPTKKGKETNLNNVRVSLPGCHVQRRASVSVLEPLGCHDYFVILVIIISAFSVYEQVSAIAGIYLYIGIYCAFGSGFKKL